MVNFYRVELSFEDITVVTIGNKSINISESDEGLLFEFSKYSLADSYKGNLLNDDSLFLKYIRENPQYIRSILKTVFEGKVELEI